MKKIKRALRLLGLASIIIVASVGIGISGAILPNTKERYHNRKILIERVDKKEEDDESEKEKKN